MPLDSIGVEVVQDSEADLEKKWINNSFEVSGHTMTMMVMDIRWKTNLRMGRVLSGSTVVRLWQVGSWRKQDKFKNNQFHFCVQQKNYFSKHIKVH